MQKKNLIWSEVTWHSKFLFPTSCLNILKAMRTSRINLTESKTVFNFFINMKRSYNQGRRLLSLGICAHLWYGNIFLFLEQIAPSWCHISKLIHAHVVGSRMDVVALRDQMVEVVAGCKAEKNNKGSSMYFHAPCLWKRFVFQGREFL